MSLPSVNEQNFEQEVVRSPVPVVIDVYGPQCRECVPLLQVAGEMAGDYADKAKFMELNSGSSGRLCAQLRVRGVPAFLIFKNGSEIARLVSGLTLANLRTKIDEALKTLA